MADGLSDPGALAEEAHRLLGVDPARARELAGQALEHARGAGDHESASVALRALGMAALDLDDAPTAVEHLRGAVAAGRRARSPRRAAEARMALAFALLNQGLSSAALRQAGLAARAVDGDAQMALQHAAILERLGRMDEALDGYRRGLTAARRAGDGQTEAKLLCNRSVLHAYRGALRAAESDLRDALKIALALDQPLLAATMLQNLGWVATRRGDLPAALTSFDAAEPVIAQAGARHGVLELDRCHALLAAGLGNEARASAQRAVQRLGDNAMAAELAEARLALAEAQLADGDAAAALAAAEQAAAEFAHQRRPGWAALAEHVAVHAAFARGERTPALHARAEAAGAALAGSGWPTAALDAQILAARVALALGRDDAAARTLEDVARARRGGPVTLRVGAWHAEALRRLAEGRRGAALRALRAGLAVLDAHRLSLGATELRAGAAVHGNALAALGLRLALASGRAGAVLEWAERGRAGALWQRPAQPPDDAALAADLAELRTVLAAIDEAGKESGDTRRLLRRQAELEAAIRRRARHAAGSADGAAFAPALGGAPARRARAARPRRVRARRRRALGGRRDGGIATAARRARRAGGDRARAARPALRAAQARARGRLGRIAGRRARQRRPCRTRARRAAARAARRAARHPRARARPDGRAARRPVGGAALLRRPRRERRALRGAVAAGGAAPGGRARRRTTTRRRAHARRGPRPAARRRGGAGARRAPRDRHRARRPPRRASSPSARRSRPPPEPTSPATARFAPTTRCSPRCSSPTAR